MNDLDRPVPLGNLAVIRGMVPHDPRAHELATGGTVVHFDVSTRIGSDPKVARVSVPVAWNDPRPAQLASVVAGAEVVVIGTIRRRFFRVGGATQSRTEVVADAVILARRHKRVDAALREAVDRLLDPVA